MLYIYKFTNKINGKIYIGQTNDIKPRKRGHKSTAFNEKSHNYHCAFHNAIRKYGWDNFDFEILEEIDDSFGREYLNEREIFFISYYQSLTSQNGYNITKGGDGCAKEQKTFEECVACSKIFTLDEVIDIQTMLIEGYAYFEIYKKYPKLTDSFLSNISSGLNFYNEKLEYPLGKNKTRFSKDAQDEIISSIKSGIPYSEIKEKFGISTGYISSINSGKRWHRDNEIYPLCFKACTDNDFGQKAIHDIIFTTLSMEKLGKTYNKSKATFTAINVGRNRYNSAFKYPLRTNAIENQKIWNDLFE